MKKKIDRGFLTEARFEGEVSQLAYILKWDTIFYLIHNLHSCSLVPEKNEKQQTRVYFKEVLSIGLVTTRLSKILVDS